MFTVKPDAGIQATSWKSGDKIYIAPFQLLPMQMFLEEPTAAKACVFPPFLIEDQIGQSLLS